jgi:hypothetical protein
MTLSPHVTPERMWFVAAACVFAAGFVIWTPGSELWTALGRCFALPRRAVRV